MKIKKGAIFVSIASYRDLDCSNTLESLYTNAEYPDKVYVGICQQNKKDDPDCIPDSLLSNRNIRIIRIPEYEARGPTYARYLCSTLWDGEEFFFQIDSHTRFVKNWDTLCIRMINDIKNKNLSKKPILSHYPKEISQETNYQKTIVPRMCQSFFNERDMISFMGAEELETHGEYYNTPYSAAGMLFCESYFLNELPFDPNLPYLFVGEEILHSIRFYTHGWDIFTPSENVIFHEYTRSSKPKIWTDNPHYSDKQAFDKVKHYIGLLKDDSILSDEIKSNIEKYGLGKVRTLDDYYKFSGIDIKNKKVDYNFCKPSIEHFENTETDYSFVVIVVIFLILITGRFLS